ncbi:MAG: inositol-3-phosphate synthase [Elusimicrobia bacterium]|nr:inositol-3-phosphate synthase [Elusimicrobiota bacterium]
MKKTKIAPVGGKLGVLIPGVCGAISTTLIGGIEAVKSGQGRPIGSLTQMGRIRLGKRTEKKNPLIKDFVPLADLDSLVFGGWDIFDENLYESALKAEVLERPQIETLKDKLSAIRPMKAAFDRKYVKNLTGPNVKKANNKFELARQLMDDIKEFKKKNSLDRAVMIWCASTETYIPPNDVHSTPAKFERAMKANHPAISPSTLYAYAAIKCGVPFINGAPNLSCNIPALVELARANKVPVAGSDYKTGQTLMKTIIAPGLKARALGINGWFSTNILGNRDGEVLDDPESFKTKEVSKLSVLESILTPGVYPELYKNLYHKVTINYYPPRGDNKEGWDNIDIFGWLGYPMQLKIDFLCRDSILAAPLALDLILFMDLAKRAGLGGIQEWLSFYFKSPMHAKEVYPENDLFVQLEKFENNLRHLMGETLITHLGVEYYK